MEKRLQEYRRRKESEFKNSSSSSFSRKSTVKKPNAVLALLRTCADYITKTRVYTRIVNTVIDIPVIGKPFVLKLILWLALFGFFVEIEFGMVYTIISAFVFIYFNTSTRKRKSSEKSAYSVFNENYERLEGTFTAEQFEKELRYGSGYT